MRFGSDDNDLHSVSSMCWNNMLAVFWGCLYFFVSTAALSSAFWERFEPSFGDTLHWFLRFGIAFRAAMVIHCFSVYSHWAAWFLSVVTL